MTHNKKGRMSGILAHPTSFPSPFGIGDLGPRAYEFIDFLSEAGQTLWQVLPLGPTGYGDSPYQSFSSFAGQPLIISPERLCEDGLLGKDDLDIPVSPYHDQVDYGQVIHYKTYLYKKAFEKFNTLTKNDSMNQSFHSFCDKNRLWLDNYALYTAIKEEEGGKSWLEWPLKLRRPSNETKEFYALKLQSSITYCKFLQFIFDRQWNTLKQYANEKNIFIIGDIPIFVALDSSDAWANQDYFQLDTTGHPLAVSGVPPDYFSATGQLWGNPLYDWDVLKLDGYQWWIDRISHQLQLVDYLRIDHFRGFEAYWSVPYGEETAIHGTWEKGPYLDFFHVLKNHFGENLPIFAEDLGLITPEVEKMRDDFGLAGMKVLQFAFDGSKDNQFLPYHYPKNCICYTGTHDNNTTTGWYHQSDELTKNRVKHYMNCGDTDISWDFIRTALSSTADYVVIPVQDLLSIGSEGRMNTPGTASGNWTWRFLKGALNKNIAKKLGSFTQTYGR